MTRYLHEPLGAAERVALSDKTYGGKNGAHRQHTAAEGNIGVESTNDDLAKELDRLAKGKRQA